MTEKRNIKSLIQQEEAHLNNLLETEDLKSFKGMVEELRDTWTKKQIFRTETEMKVAVLDDGRYPTRASKYWQCVREQNVFLENLMSLSFDYRRNEAKIKQLQKKLETETDEYKKELYQIDLDEKIYKIEKDEELAMNDELSQLRKDRVFLKDEIFTFLKKLKFPYRFSFDWRYWGLTIHCLFMKVIPYSCQC